MRLTNFNVEAQCTPSRSAILTGRYAIRSGNGTTPLGSGVYGLVQWEVTLAEMLSDAGYSAGSCAISTLMIRTGSDSTPAASTIQFLPTYRCMTLARS